MKRIWLVALAIVMILTCFVGCGGKDDTETTDPNANNTTTESTTEKAVSGNINLLTGLSGLSDEAVGKRPMAIMINNIKSSLPQYGISSADILYEIVTEGGITRMMAIYGDYTKIPNVCSVRSCRYYFPIFAQGYDAVYFCFGANETLGYPTLKRIGIDYFDGKTYGTKLFDRDQERRKTYALEHTGYVKGPNIPSVLKSEKVRTDLLDEMNKTAFNFISDGTAKAPSKKSCTKVNVQFSYQYYSTFKYDKKKDVYYKSHSGNAHKDSATGKQLSFTNLFILQTDIHNYKNQSIMEVDWKGGDGYYVSHGAVCEIKWEKKSEASSIVYYDKETGEELKVNPGKSYIAVAKKGQTTLKGETA